MKCRIKKIDRVSKEKINVYDISIPTTHNFILSNGAIVHNCDSYQSADLLQALKARNFNAEILSVDRLVDRVCQPYQYLKSTIYEERLEMYENTLLTEELIGLERDNNSGKIDHSPSGINSKDTADGLCGAVFNASKHAEEFAFDYGETLDVIKEVSEQTDFGREQASIDFEKELNRVFDPISSNKKEDNQFMDFGMGRATSNFNTLFLADGILAW